MMSCESDDPVEPTIDGFWEMKKITNTQDEIITEELWGSVFWDFDLATEEVEILVDYFNILENIKNNGGSENYPNGIFHGLTDGIYEVKVSSDASKNNIQIGTGSKGTFILNGNELILKLDYDNGQISATEIYYFEKSKRSDDRLY
tara:strand:- start:446 stop:883 length:438 start_codon:yes stop_codon:yes gene_type:complete